MGARDLIALLRADGFSVRLSETGIGISPGSRLTAEVIAAISNTRTQVIEALQEEESTRSSLLEAVDRLCDARGDDQINRADLVAECQVQQASSQRDLLEHFQREAGRWERANRGEMP
jgi:hypothetical protein